jgi:hypothetical protein
LYGGLGHVGEASLNKRLLIRLGGGFAVVASLSFWPWWCGRGLEAGGVFLQDWRSSGRSSQACAHPSSRQLCLSYLLPTRRQYCNLRRGGLLLFCCVSSTTPRHTKWSRPRWLGDGRWQKIHAGREPTSCLLMFLGGDAWRTSASGGRDTEVLDCFAQIRCRVFFLKCKILSLNTGF